MVVHIILLTLIKALISGNANNGTNAGFSYFNSNNGVSNANANRSFLYISE